MGGSEHLEVDYTELAEALMEMQEALDRFRDINSRVFQPDVENLEAMNSDFVQILERFLEYFPGWHAEDLLEKIKLFCSDADKIMDDLKGTDEAHSKSREEG